MGNWVDEAIIPILSFGVYVFKVWVWGLTPIIRHQWKCVVGGVQVCMVCTARLPLGQMGTPALPAL